MPHEDYCYALERENHALNEEIESLRQQLADVQAEVEEESAVRERLAKLLAETAIALKGEEAALTKHSWHDLAQCATEVINERDDHIKREVMLRYALELLWVGTNRDEWDGVAINTIESALATEPKP